MLGDRKKQRLDVRDGLARQCGSRPILGDWDLRCYSTFSTATTTKFWPSFFGAQKRRIFGTTADHTNFSPAGLDTLLILHIAMVLKERAEQARYRHIDEKNGNINM